MQGLTFYVTRAGSDSNDGLSRERAFRTIARGLVALRHGRADFLEIEPGAGTGCESERWFLTIDGRLVVSCGEHAPPSAVRFVA